MSVLARKSKVGSSRPPRKVSPELVAKIRETQARTGNRSATALELDVPRSTVIAYTKDMPGSPLGGGKNPCHAGRRVAVMDSPPSIPAHPVSPPPAAPAPEPVDPIAAEQERIERVRRFRAEHEAVKAIAGERSLRSHLDGLFESITPLFPPPPEYVPPAFSPSATEETLLLHLSDWHAYEEVKPERVMGLNHYDAPTFGSRVKQVVDTVGSIKHRMERGDGWRFPKLVIAANGDFVSGTIHEVERHSDAPNVILAVYGAAMVFASAVRDLSAQFESVEVFCTSGNHGRLPDARRMQQKDPLRNWDTLIYLIAKTALANCPNVSWFIPNSYSVSYAVGCTKVLQTHGHDIKSWNSIPFYGLNRFATNINALMASNSRKIDAFMVGHFHSLGSIEAAGAEYFVNGSLIGGTEFSVNGLGRCDAPKQWMLGIHKEHGITHRWPILARSEDGSEGYYTKAWDTLTG